MAKRSLFLIALLPAIATSQAVEGDRWGVTASADAEADRASDKKKDSASSVSVESPSTPSPTVTCHNIEIGLVFDEYPDETKWQITKGRRNSIEHDAAVVLKESPYYDPEEGYSEASETHIICLPPGKYTYTIMDRNRDGMCCDEGEGRYALTYQETGDIITHGSEFEQYESVTFNVPYVAPMLKDTDGDGVEDRTKNVIPPMILGSDGFPAETCENEFGLTLKTDDYGIETTWELRERSTTGKYEDGKVVASGGPYTSDFIYDVSYCILPGKYTFVFYDWQCDGLTGTELEGYYTLKVNGEEVHRGGTRMDNYWEEVEMDFDNSVEAKVPDNAPELMRGDESGGSGKKLSWMLAVVGAGAAALAWN